MGIRTRSGTSFHSHHLILTTFGHCLIRAGCQPVTDRFLIASLLSHTVLLSHWEVLPSAPTMMIKGKFYSVKISLLMQISEVLLCLFDFFLIFFKVRMREIRFLKEHIFKRNQKRNISVCIYLSLNSQCSFLPYCRNKEHKNAGTVYHASPLLLSTFYLLLYFPYFKISFSILLRRRAQDYNLTIVMRMGYVCAISHFHYNLCGKSNVTEFLMSYILHEHFFPVSSCYNSMDDAVAEHCNFDLFIACIMITLAISPTSPKWKIF